MNNYDIINNLNDNDDNGKNDTMIEIDTGKTQKFCISRHLNSCNNMVDSASWTNVLYKFEEPPLSLWGIISGLALQREPYEKEVFQEKNCVYVSCLVRTWMTAIIEYLPYCNKNEISLIISPYIKEADISNKFYVGQSIDKGNMPIDVKSQIEKIKYFFSILKLVQIYITKYNNNDDKCEKIKKNINTILTDQTKINIIFPPYETIKNRKQVKIRYSVELIYNSNNNQLNSTTYLFEGNNKIIDTDVNYDIDPYAIGIRKENNIELEINNENDEMIGGSNSTNKQQDYFNEILTTFLKQNENNLINNEEIILSNNENKKINIKKNETKNSSYMRNKPRIDIYTKSFGKEAILLFIDWIKNIRNDKSEYIYVVAHSNIMQASLYNICSKLNNNVNVNKRNVNATCNTNGIQNIVKQNIWEIIIEVNEEFNKNLYIKSVKIRKGQDKPDNNSKRKLSYNREKELSCGSNINNINNYIKQEQSEEQKEQLEENLNQYSNQNQNQFRGEELPLQKPSGLWSKFKGFFFKNKQGGYNCKTFNHKTCNRKTCNRKTCNRKTCKKYKSYKKTKINKKRNYKRKITCKNKK